MAAKYGSHLSIKWVVDATTIKTGRLGLGQVRNTKLYSSISDPTLSRIAIAATILKAAPCLSGSKTCYRHESSGRAGRSPLEKSLFDRVRTNCLNLDFN